MKEDPHIFSSIAQKQDLKLLWIDICLFVDQQDRKFNLLYIKMKVALILESLQMLFWLYFQANYLYIETLLMS